MPAQRTENRTTKQPLISPSACNGEDGLSTRLFRTKIKKIQKVRHMKKAEISLRLFHSPADGRLAKQLQNRLRLLIGLGQHSCGSLLNDLTFRKIRRGLRIISVLDTAARSCRIRRDVRQVIDGILEAVDHRTHIAALLIDRRNRRVGSINRGRCSREACQRGSADADEGA